MSCHRYLAAAASGAEKPQHIGSDAARFFVGLLVRLAGRRVLLVDEYERLAGVQGRFLEVEVSLRSLVQDLSPVVRSVEVVSVPPPAVEVASPADGTAVPAGTAVVLTGRAIPQQPAWTSVGSTSSLERASIDFE